ncbi:PP2C family protein-serine/threonine phosphatase [Streptomyces specialis]|uniref:PP2C family protein-serine/threonine phosphatase n=1 Tax=Streptomyces specialis TaxID=498367 RepID=UPI00073E98F7|nr:PP2C family protein-serine/threonine phosphatase [Streptomyces specialis]
MTRAAPGLVPHWLLALPPLLLAAVAVTQWASPHWVQLGFVFAALPPLAGLIYGPWATALLASAVMALLVLPATRAPHVSDADLGAVAAIAVFGVLVSAIRTRYTRDLVVVRDVAEAAQRAVLPPLPERVGRGRGAGLYRAAQVGAVVGGDLFDVRAGPFGVRALVADVRGHGLAAVGTVAALLGAFREAVLDEPDLGRVAARLDRRLVVDARASGNEEVSELFATALLLEFAERGDEMRLVACGHPPALLIRDGRARELAAEPVPPLGLGAGAPVPPRPGAVPLRAGDLVLAYTDGVIEARDGAGTFYPLAERVTGRLGAGGPEPEALVESVWRDVSGFAAGITDDVALLALRPDG